MHDLVLSLYQGEFLEKVENSIRPFTYSQDLGEYSYLGYGMHGTGFFLLYGDDPLFITARHNFEKSNTLDKYQSVSVAIDSFFIIKKMDFIDLKYQDSRVCIDNIYLQAINFDEFNSDDRLGSFDSYDLHDIATVSLCESIEHSVLKMPYNSTVSAQSPTSEDDTKISKIGDKIWIIGHPAETNHTQYDEVKKAAAMSFSRTHLIGLFKSKADGIVEVEIKYDNKTSDYSGFSGSPVFLIDDSADSITPKLTGMVIKGSAKNNIIHFISIEYIYLYLFQLDINTAMFGSKVPSDIIHKIISDIKKLKIGSIKYENKKIIISLGSGEILSIDPSHHYIIKAIMILSSNKAVINGESIYIMQEIILATRNDTPLFNYLSEIYITSDILAEIKTILKDGDIRMNMGRTLKNKTIQERLSKYVDTVE